MKPLDIRQCQGQTITRLYVQDWTEHEEVEAVAPGEMKLLNFDVGDWLVLDPYGNDLMSETIRDRVFGKHEATWTIAVNRLTGQIGTAHYFIDTDLTSVITGPRAMFIAPWMYDMFAEPTAYRLPAEFLARIDELRNKKRPVSTHIEAGSLQDFIDREVGFRELQSDVVFQFHFDGPGDWRTRTYLQVHQDTYRVCSEWRDTVPPVDVDDDTGDDTLDGLVDAVEPEIDPATGKPFEPGFWRCECGVLNNKGVFAGPYRCFECAKPLMETF